MTTTQITMGYARRADVSVASFRGLSQAPCPNSGAWACPLQGWTMLGLDGPHGARPGASAHFPLGALPAKPQLAREWSTVCRVTFVCGRDRGSCVCADLVPVSCLSLSCLSLPVSFSSGGLGTGAHTPQPLLPSQDMPWACVVPPPPAPVPRAPAGMDTGDTGADRDNPDGQRPHSALAALQRWIYGFSM